MIMNENVKSKLITKKNRRKRSRTKEVSLFHLRVNDRATIYEAKIENCFSCFHINNNNNFTEGQLRADRLGKIDKIFIEVEMIEENKR